MSITAQQITIAVTVFNRRQYLKEAIASALGQTASVRVMVVEDCGPAPDLEEFVRREFGPRVEYHRSPRNRGIFGNWNACMDYCTTPWLSILHDDDHLAPGFIEAMLDLSRQAPDCGLYFGETEMFSETGEVIPCGLRSSPTTPWRRVELAETVIITPFPFPGQLFRVDYARALGGFRETSQFAGDWEMWSNLIARYGGAQSRALVAYNRCHLGPERGCTLIALNGKSRPLVFVQQKRVLSLLQGQGVKARFDRAEFLRRCPMSISDLIRYGAGFSPRLLRYNVGLLLRSTPPSGRYALFQGLTRALGVRFVRVVSGLRRHLARAP